MTISIRRRRAKVRTTAVTDQPAVIRRILEDLGLPAERVRAILRAAIQTARPVVATLVRLIKASARRA